MSKYAFLGLFFTVLVVIMGSLSINHMSNTNYMQGIDVGLESAAIGLMRESDGVVYGVRAQDLQAELTKEIVERQADTGRVIGVSFKYYDENDNFISYDDAITANSLVYSVQYKVNLYKLGTEVDELDSNDVPTGRKIIPADAKPQSSTENRISLIQN